MSTSDKNIAAEDVKHKLLETLKTRGVLDSFKSQLRKQLIWQLQDSTGLPVLQSSVSSPTDADKKSDGTLLYQRIANCLVAEHLKRCKYEYTLSTFLPESGTSTDKIFSLKDILHLLHIDAESVLYKKLEHSLISSPRNSKGFLWQFIKELTILQTKDVCDAGIQTDQPLPNKAGSLEEKLSTVEKEFSEKLKLFQLDKNQSIEEKLIAVQKKYEIQKKKELQDEIKKFKASEISRLRLEEREKYETEIKKMRQEYHQEYNLKTRALSAMEKEMMERLQRLKEVQETEAYSERQKCLQEMNSFKEREADLRKKAELQERSQKIEEDRLANEVGRLNILENALKEKETFQEERYKTEIERFKRDYQHQFTTRHQDLLIQESSLKVDRSKLDTERNMYLKCQDDLNTYKERTVQLEASLETSRLLLESTKKEKVVMQEKLAAMKDYEVLKQKEIILKKDIEHLTQRLNETNAHCKQQEKRHQSFVKELTDRAGKPSKEFLDARKEIKDVKEKHKAKEKSLNETRKNLENRLKVEVQRANHFQTLYEDQITSQNLMENEIVHLKMIQQQTEQLLSMELRHQRANDSHLSLTSREKSNVAGKTGGGSSDRESSTKKFDTDDSSGVDDSSMVSLAEQKKIFQKLEREAEALDASYRDFQNRIHQPHSQTFTSIPSSMTFRRLPSYHTFRSPQKASILKDTWVSSTAPTDGFFPLQTYDGSGVQMLTKTLRKSTGRINQPRISLTTLESKDGVDEEIEIGKIRSDENVALTIKDLKTSQSQTSSPEKTSSLQVQNVFSDNFSQPILTGDFEHRGGLHTEQHQLNNSGTTEQYNGASEHHVKPSKSNVGTVSDQEILNNVKSTIASSETVDRKSRSSSQRSESVGTLNSMQGAHGSGVLHHVKETTLDSMWKRQQQQHSMESEHHRTSASLDMEELERRRHEDDERRKIEVEEHTIASGLEETLSGEDVNTEDLQSDNKGLILSEDHVETSERKNVEVTNETDQQEVTIDPVMLKYMEMIKQRRENEAEKQQDEDVDNLVEKGDSDVSIGKLSDDDFNWD